MEEQQENKQQQQQQQEQQQQQGHEQEQEQTSSVSSTPVPAPVPAPAPVSDSSAASHKTLGNSLYQSGQYEASIVEYTKAIQLTQEHAENSGDPLDQPSLSVYLNNRAAAYLMLSRYGECLDDAVKAIEHGGEKNVKARYRKMTALEKLDRLDEALEECHSILADDPANEAAALSKPRLEAAVQKKNEKLKDEMLGKLKDVGNGLLGKFGLSLDNFQSTKDPVTGNYSIAFKK